MIGIAKMGYKKTANYGIAANQILYPMGNDNTKVINIYEICKCWLILSQ